MMISRALTHIRPGEEWILEGEKYAGLTWFSETPKPTEAEIVRGWQEIAKDVAMEPIRNQRDKLLYSSDWTQIADAPVNAEAWAKYRQKLRDLPATVEDPTATIVWPTPPA